ncbi:MAG: hypothetical protein IPP77_06095 [Bacteroidetes bacterium]|nr:hypothetical protein [Bacteroidota bacterium]
MKTLYTSLFLLLSLFSFCQNQQGIEQPNEAQKKLNALKGTYEIKRLSRERYLLPSNLADVIIKNRKAKELTVVKLNEGTELVIYPFASLEKAAKNKTRGTKHE